MQTKINLKPVLALFLLPGLLACGGHRVIAEQSPPPDLALRAEPEVRGTWMTTTNNTAIASPAKTQASMRRLRDIGLNTVYVEVWKNGYTQFPSQVLKQTLGVDCRPNLLPGHEAYPADQMKGQPRDLLEETLIAAHRNQLIYIGWFEYGFMAAYTETDNHLRRQYPQWMTTTREGKLVSDQNPFVWMNPLRPECQDFLLGIVLEAVDKYDLDGVQLDDRIAWPVTMGYDDYTKQVYAKEHNGAMPPEDPRDPQWVQWRAEKVTVFAERFYRKLKEKRPKLIVSISPAVYPWSLDNYACDWKTWNARGWMDEFVPQVYRLNYEAFAPTWREQVEVAGDRVGDLIAGLRVVGDGPNTTWPDTVKKINDVRAAKAGGHCHWYSVAVLETYPDQFEAFYNVKDNGQAPHPKLPTNWRPAPITPVDSSDQAWTFQINDAGRYRLIVLNGEVWRELKSVALDAGRIQIPRGEEDAMELLVDRREP